MGWGDGGNAVWFVQENSSNYVRIVLLEPERHCFRQWLQGDRSVSVKLYILEKWNLGGGKGGSVFHDIEQILLKVIWEYEISVHICKRQWKVVDEM